MAGRRPRHVENGPFRSGSGVLRAGIIARGAAPAAHTYSFPNRSSSPTLADAGRYAQRLYARGDRIVRVSLVIRGERCGTMVFYSQQLAISRKHQRRKRGRGAGKITAARSPADCTRRSATRGRRPITRGGRRRFSRRRGPQRLARLRSGALAAVAKSAPTMADWCTVDVVNADGSLQRLAA